MEYLHKPRYMDLKKWRSIVSGNLTLSDNTIKLVHQLNVKEPELKRLISVMNLRTEPDPTHTMLYQALKESLEEQIRAIYEKLDTLKK